MATESTETTKGESSEVLELVAIVRQTAFELHTFLRHGHMEKVYENGLAHRLQRLGLSVDVQVPIQVRDEDGTLLGDFFADLVVNDILIVELKACKALADEHTAQVLGYLRASSKRHALLINFGAPIIQFKKFIL